MNTGALPQSGLDRWLDDPTRLWAGWAGLWSARARTHTGMALHGALRDAGRSVTALSLTQPIADTMTAMEGQLRSTIDRIRPAGILVDLPDIGLRTQPEGAWLTALLRVVSGSDLPILVLDRPNPLDGTGIEGPTVHPGFENPMALPGLPLRHGLTPGERARFTVREERLQVNLDVLPCTGWRRDMDHTETALPTHLPGREVAPWIDALAVVPGATAWATFVQSDALCFGGPWPALAQLQAFVHKGADDADVQGVTIEPCTFTPTDGPWTGRPCTGVQITSSLPSLVHTLKVGLVLLEAALRVHASTGCPAPVPSMGTHHDLDLLLGSPEGRLGLAARVRTTELLDAWEPDIQRFRDDREAALLY